MKEIVGYTLLIVALMVLIAVANVLTNENKAIQCQRAGGQLILNINAEHTTCIMPPNKEK